MLPSPRVPVCPSCGALMHQYRRNYHYIFCSTREIRPNRVQDPALLPGSSSSSDGEDSSSSDEDVEQVANDEGDDNQEDTSDEEDVSDEEDTS